MFKWIDESTGEIFFYSEKEVREDFESALDAGRYAYTDNEDGFLDFLNDEGLVPA